MTVNIGTCLDDPRKMNKSPSLTISANCDIHDATDIMNPVFILAYNAAYIGCNYMYVPDWGRYYYITAVTALSGTRMQIEGKEDTLQTFAAELSEIECAINKQEQFEGVATLFFKDPDIIPRQDTVTFTQLFSSVPSWDTGHVYLTTVG